MIIHYLPLGRKFLLCLLLFAFTLICSARAAEREGPWKAYLEYFDPARRTTFICYYDSERIARPVDSSRKVVVWDKEVPQSRYEGDWGASRGRRFLDATNLYEIDCKEGRFRALETFIHDEGLVRHDLTPSHWQDIETSDRHERLLEETCSRTSLHAA